MLSVLVSAASFVPSTGYRPATTARLRRPVMVEREELLVDRIVLIQNQLERMELQRTIAELQSQLSTASSQLQGRDGSITELQLKLDHSPSFYDLYFYFCAGLPKMVPNGVCTWQTISL